MAKAYSVDMRQWVIDRAESSATGREVARYYEVSPLYGSDPGEALSRDRHLAAEQQGCAERRE